MKKFLAWIALIVVILLIGGAIVYLVNENYTKVFARATIANEMPKVNPEQRFMFLNELPGEQTNWAVVGKAARYDMTGKKIDSDYRFVLEEQQYNWGYRYKLSSKSMDIADVPLAWRKNKITTGEVIQEDEGYAADNGRISPHVHYYLVSLDTSSRFTGVSGDMFTNNEEELSREEVKKYRGFNIDVPMRRQV